ncbi:hypothetical protein D3C84_997660 [compost metagenome]
MSLALLALLADKPERVSKEVLPAADMPMTRYHGKSYKADEPPPPAERSARSIAIACLRRSRSTC